MFTFFEKNDCESYCITFGDNSQGKVLGFDVLRGKLYLIDFIPKEVELDRCLIAKTNMGWLWH
jgi:hypothetical protein